MPGHRSATPRLLTPICVLALLLLPGCLAVAATGAVIGAAGDIAEGAIDVVTTSDEEEARRERRRNRD